MGKLIAILTMLVVLGVGLAAGTLLLLRPQRAESAAPQQATPSVLAASEQTPMVVQGRVVPVRNVALYMAKGVAGDSVVTEVLAEEGAMVAQGAPLARIDTRDLELRVEEARAALALAQATRDEIQAKASQATTDGAAAPDTGAVSAAQVARAMAQMQQAEAALKRAELALDQATLRAPMDGTVVDINLNVDEPPSAVTPAVVLADVSRWQIETTVTEQLVSRIQQDAPVRATFSALPELEMSGKVTHINALGQPMSSNTPATYVVVITPDQQDARLRWNMTATVTITLSE